jgi:hypothetical protein
MCCGYTDSKLKVQHKLMSKRTVFFSSTSDVPTLCGSSNNETSLSLSSHVLPFFYMIFFLICCSYLDLSVGHLIVASYSEQEPGQPSQYSNWLWAGQPSGQEFESQWEQELSLPRVIQTGSEAHPASSPMGTWE